MTENKTAELIIEDALAQKLENAGLWRRAAARWLVVMDSPLFTDGQREWVRQRRQYCLSQVAPIAPPEKLDIVAVAKAAKETQIRMGIDSPQGSAFRTYPPASRKLKAK